MIVCLPQKREVMLMYMTWDEMFLFGALIIALIQLVRDIYKDNNKKR